MPEPANFHPAVAEAPFEVDDYKAAIIANLSILRAYAAHTIDDVNEGKFDRALRHHIQMAASVDQSSRQLVDAIETLAKGN